MNAKTQKKYDIINRVAPRTVIASTYQNVAYGTVKQSIVVRRVGWLGTDHGTPLYHAWLSDDTMGDGEYERTHSFLIGEELAASIRDLAESMETVPQEKRLRAAIVDTLAYYGIN